MNSRVSKRAQNKEENEGVKIGLYPTLASTPPPHPREGTQIQAPLDEKYWGTVKNPRYIISILGKGTGRVAGSHWYAPGRRPSVLETICRGAVLAGVPKTVKDSMEANPDIPGCTTETWERHLHHHYNAMWMKRNKPARKKQI
ncbi:hypothetical protein Q8A73_018795 [Channa argus]|nr:hypothetical protein Q8A73_018795 [Channa argus]